MLMSITTCFGEALRLYNMYENPYKYSMVLENRAKAYWGLSKLVDKRQNIENAVSDLQNAIELYHAPKHSMPRKRILEMLASLEKELAEIGVAD